MAVMLMAFAARHRAPRGYAAAHVRFLVARRVRDLAAAGWALLVPVIIIGGIVGGLFTPTEAGVIAVVYALIVAMRCSARCASPTSRGSSSIPRS